MSDGTVELSTDADELLSFHRVSKEYTSGDKRLLILDEIELSIKRGMSIAITGKSGSGKSTMLNLAGGLDSPTVGSVMFLGKDLALMNDRELSEFRNSQVGFIFQSHVLLDDFTAFGECVHTSVDCWRKIEAGAYACGESTGKSRLVGPPITPPTEIIWRRTTEGGDLQGIDEQSITCHRG